MTKIATIPTVHDRRRRWKPHKERLGAEFKDAPLARGPHFSGRSPRPCSHRGKWRQWRPFVAVVLAAQAWPVEDVKAEEPPAVRGPLFQEAATEFRTMTTTLYQHKTQVDRATGSYRYDCVGFVSYALQRAAPQAWTTTVRITGIPKGRIPSPPRYRAFFASLVEKPQPGWEAVTKASALRPATSWHGSTRRRPHPATRW